MLKILIVDDEEAVGRAIAQLLGLYHPDCKIAGICNSLSPAIDMIRQEQPDVVLLDIEIGHESGFDIFKAFPKPAFKVIFITAFQQYALQAFRFSALDYLLKPVDPDLLAAALGKATDSIDREKLLMKIDSFLHNITSGPHEPKRLVLKTADSVHVVNVSDIMYCRADGPYTSFHLSDKSRIIISVNMGAYEDLLLPFLFIRIHQSYLLNLHFMTRYEKGDGMAVLRDGTSLPVASRKKDLLLQRLSQL